MRFVPVALACLSLVACPHAPGVTAAEARQRFDDPDAWAQRFEDPQRDAWQKPAEVLAALALPRNAFAADLGAATGYFTVRLAQALPDGRVYGVDVEKAMVDYLGRRLATEGLQNAEAVLATADDAKLPGKVDLVLMVNTFHYLDDRVAYLRRLAGSLQPGGRVAVIDFRPRSKLGPPVDQKLTPAQVEAEFAGAGFPHVQRFDFLPEQDFLVFSR